MKNKNETIIAEGEVIKINNEFYFGKRINGRIEETENILEVLRNNLKIGKKIQLIIKELND